MASYIIPVHPLKVAVWKRQRYALPTWSKFITELIQVSFSASQTSRSGMTLGSHTAPEASTHYRGKIGAGCGKTTGWRYGHLRPAASGHLRPAATGLQGYSGPFKTWGGCAYGPRKSKFPEPVRPKRCMQKSLSWKYRKPLLLKTIPKRRESCYHGNPAATVSTNSLLWNQ